MSTGGRSRFAAVFYGVTALALGVAVALVKLRLAAHRTRST